MLVPLVVVREAGLIEADPPLSHSVTYFWMVFEGSAFLVFTHNPIGVIIHPTWLRVAMGAAPPIPPEGALTEDEPHADFSVIFLIELVPFLDFLPLF